MCSGRERGGVFSVILCFNFCWGAVVKLRVEPLVVEPPHPFQGRQLDLLDNAPWATLLDQFRLEQRELGLG